MCVTYSALFVTDMTSVSVKTLIGTMFSFVSNVSVHVSNNNVQVSRITCLSIIERKVCFNLRTTNLDLYLTYLNVFNTKGAYTSAQNVVCIIHFKKVSCLTISIKLA